MCLSYIHKVDVYMIACVVRNGAGQFLWEGPRGENASRRTGEVSLAEKGAGPGKSLRIGARGR